MSDRRVSPANSTVVKRMGSHVVRVTLPDSAGVCHVACTCGAELDDLPQATTGKAIRRFNQLCANLAYGHLNTLAYEPPIAPKDGPSRTWRATSQRRRATSPRRTRRHGGA